MYFRYLLGFIGFFAFATMGYSYSSSCNKKIKQSYNDGFEDGYDDGYSHCNSSYDGGFVDGKKEGWKLGHAKGYAEGKSIGWKLGQESGYKDGYAKAKAEYPQAPEINSTCAYVFKWNGKITTSDISCANETSCDDDNRNTLDLCILQSTPDEY
jgi:hypothetical protein